MSTPKHLFLCMIAIHKFGEKKKVIARKDKGKDGQLRLASEWTFCMFLNKGGVN